MNVARTTDRRELEAYLRTDAPSQIYALADLDDFFWPSTTWYAGYEAGRIVAACLVLKKLSIPVLYAVCPSGHARTADLVTSVEGELPARFFVNLGLGLEKALGESHTFHSVGEHQKMYLPDRDAVDAARAVELDVAGVEVLSSTSIDELAAFYRDEAYLPDETEDRFFEPYMLEIGPYVAIRERGRIIAAGGVHVVSRTYGVAAIGNIATRPDRRGRGYGRAIAARLCQVLLDQVPLIGLNVHVQNAVAIRCYERLGFRVARRYVEGVMERRSGGRDA
jgi:predicted GNAT family acetyltransferase